MQVDIPTPAQTHPGNQGGADDAAGVRPGRRLWPWLAVAWMALIFGTSCTVVQPFDFFRWMHAHVFRSESGFYAFEVFWGYSWFTIVKGWHALEFGLLFLLCFAALNRWKGGPSRGKAAAAMLLCALFAVSDEWHQTFVPGRGGLVADVVIDCLGICVAAGVKLRRIARPATQ